MGATHLLVELSVFARNVIIARLAGAETLGEFIFLILAMRLFIMSTDLATERFLIQTEKSNLYHALATAHFIVRIRSVLLAVLLIIMGITNTHNIDMLVYVWLAATAIMQGYTHQGYKVQQRQLNYKPAFFVEGLSTFTATIAMILVVGFVPNLMGVCAVLFGQALMRTALSHILSHEYYAVKLDQKTFKSMIKFGLPLLLTGVTMFWSMQGERVILAAMMPASDFAYFSMMFQLALVPVLLISRMTISLGLPAMVRSKGHPEVFGKQLARFQTMVISISILYGISFLFLANPALKFLFGPEFIADYPLIVLVCFAQVLRLCRSPQSVAAQALGQTDIPLKANLVRVIAVFFAFVWMITGGSVFGLLMIACCGEAVAITAQSALFSCRNRAFLKAIHQKPTDRQSDWISTIKSSSIKGETS